MHVFQVASIGTGICLALVPKISEWQKFDSAVILWLVLCIVADSLISVSLVWYLVSLSSLFCITSSFDLDLNRADEERAQLPWIIRSIVSLQVRSHCLVYASDISYVLMTLCTV